MIVNEKFVTAVTARMNGLGENVETEDVKAILLKVPAEIWAKYLGEIPEYDLEETEVYEEEIDFVELMTPEYGFKTFEDLGKDSDEEEW